jgi:hypothetical protein
MPICNEISMMKKIPASFFAHAIYSCKKNIISIGSCISPGLLTLVSTLSLTCGAWADDMPRLVTASGVTQLIVDDQPFTVLGGELGNSSASSIDYMKPLWSKLGSMQLNTLLAPVYWDLLEPEEGTFDFTLVDNVIQQARDHQMKLILLWFGSWKNSMSCYTPEWIKRNQARFSLARDDKGISQQILTPFDEDNLKADVKAYSALLRHIKAVDNQHHTVIMIQVENEIGMLPSARDHHPLADRAFAQPVPAALLKYMQTHKDSLMPSLKQQWEQQGAKTQGNWQAVFGSGLATDELFIAWYLASYAQQVAAAGKAIYPLPTFVNAALNRPNLQPGQYPSGGPLPHLLDIWKAAAPAIDLRVPDFYNPDFTYWNDLYRSQGDALFIPEIRLDQNNGAKAFYAIGHYGALGISPFSIDGTPEPEQESIAKAYGVLRSLLPLIGEARTKRNIAGALVDKAKPEQQISLGDFVITVKHDYTMGWSPNAKDDYWPEGGVTIIQTGPEDFYVAGTGVVVTFAHKSAQRRVGLASIFEGNFFEGRWRNGRNLNGDENHQGRHVRINTGDYATQKLRVYTYQ